MLPAGLRDAAGDTYMDLVSPAPVDLVSPAAAAGGEPWRAFCAPDDMSALLPSHGFGAVRHITQRDSVPGPLWQRSDALRPLQLSVLAHATAGAPHGGR